LYCLIKAYVTALDPEALSDADHRRLAAILAFATNMEQAADVVDKGLLAVAAKQQRRGLAFSKEGEGELLGMLDRLIANVRAAASLFMTEDARVARLLANEKGAFRDLEQHATAAHFARLRAAELKPQQPARCISMHFGT
jgi:phosphate:Na+ symporter